VRIAVSKLLDRIFEQATRFLGSTVVILLSVAWCVKAFLDGNREFLDIISMVTFVFGELILRGQNVQSDRMEKNLKRDLRKSDKVLKKL
jgi:hypothetical protein